LFYFVLWLAFCLLGYPVEEVIEESCSARISAAELLKTWTNNDDDLVGI
jgi:hypothetical protein